MKREEKNQNSRRKIIDSALQEFATQGYGSSSINTICAAGGISKGVLYHYFRDKDEVYLTCVRECFGVLTHYLREHVLQQQGEAQEQLQAYFNARLAFFRANPLCQRLFCETVVSPPAHLAAAIKEIRADFDQLNLEILEQLLERVRLRPELTKGEVLSLFIQYQDLINAKSREDDAVKADVAAYEQSRRRALSILLYGIIARGDIEE